MLLKAKGTFRITPESIKIVLDDDFCRFYQWLFNKAHCSIIKTQRPAHGAHIGIVNPKIHKNINTTTFNHLDGQEIWFEYDITGNFGGFSKGFKNFWLDVYSKRLDGLAQELGVFKEDPNFASFHITILNTKNLQ